MQPRRRIGAYAVQEIVVTGQSRVVPTNYGLEDFSQWLYFRNCALDEIRKPVPTVRERGSQITTE